MSWICLTSFNLLSPVPGQDGTLRHAKEAPKWRGLRPFYAAPVNCVTQQVQLADGSLGSLLRRLLPT